MFSFFFNYRHGTDYSADDVGLEFENVEEAYIGAFGGALDMWPELLKQRVDPRLSSFEVCDAQGQLLFILPFVEVLDVCRRDARPRPATGDNTFREILAAAKRANRGVSELRNELTKTRLALTEAKILIAKADAVLNEEFGAAIAPLPRAAGG